MRRICKKCISKGMNKLFIELNDHLKSSKNSTQLFYNDPFISSIYHQLRELDEEASIKYIIDAIFILCKVKQNLEELLRKNLENL